MTDNRPTMTSARSRIGTSRLGGVPTTLPVSEAAAAQALPLDFGARPTQRHDLMPGVVLITGWLDLEQQKALVDDFRGWALPPAGLRHPRVPSGHLMTVQSVCLGWHWQPYAYSRTADDTDRAPVKPIPCDLVRTAQQAVADTFGTDAGARYAPDAVIANLYTAHARLGLHQDGEEPSDAPVVTISVGDTCQFRMAGVDRRTARSPTSSCSPGMCSCSAGRVGASSTACPRSTRARDHTTSGFRPAG